MKITQYAQELKLTDQAITTAIRNMQTLTALDGIPALLPDYIPHLLGFNWCNTPVYSGTANKADALNIAMFLKSRPGEIKKFKSPEDIREALDT